MKNKIMLAKVRLFLDMHIDEEKRKIILISLFLIVLGVLAANVFANRERIREIIFKNETEIVNIDVVTYNQDEDYINVSIKPSNEQKACAFAAEKVDSRLLSFTNLIDDTCNIDIPYKAGYVYFKNYDGVSSEPIELNNYVIDFGVKDNYYVALNDTRELMTEMVIMGNPQVEVSSDDITIEDNVMSSNENVKGKVKLSIGSIQEKEVNVTFTDTIVAMPKEYDSKKKTLTCKAYTEEEAALLDEILESRVNDAGYGTRAGAVAVARFIALEFPYKISYYYENGRISGQVDHNFVDGEGRYYHKGLYLSESKYKDLKASISGPAMWGCKITNWEDNEADGYIRGLKMPNGLDCSGYVSWNLLNGGFDPGDYGAGETPEPHQMTDLGDYTKLSMSLINSGKIKAGDLFNVWGHIAFIAGVDENNFYVVESLNTFRHLIMVKYPKKSVMNTFTHVVFMDDYYGADGNYSDMWY